MSHVTHVNYTQEQVLMAGGVPSYLVQDMTTTPSTSGSLILTTHALYWRPNKIRRIFTRTKPGETQDVTRYQLQHSMPAGEHETSVAQVCVGCEIIICVGCEIIICVGCQIIICVGCEIIMCAEHMVQSIVDRVPQNLEISSGNLDLVPGVPGFSWILSLVLYYYLVITNRISYGQNSGTLTNFSKHSQDSVPHSPRFKKKAYQKKSFFFDNEKCGVVHFL